MDIDGSMILPATHAGRQAGLQERGLRVPDVQVVIAARSLSLLHTGYQGVAVFSQVATPLLAECQR